MAEPTDERPEGESPFGDLKVSQLYRELPAEEPAPALDAAIRARAHGAATSHEAPLVPPVGRRSWAFPAAAAAVIVLAIAVTSQLEREAPDEPAGVPAPEASTVKPAPAAAKKKVDARPAPAKEQPRVEAFERQAEPEQGIGQAAAPAARDEARVLARSVAIEPPERWLERIAALRKEGRDEEADRELADFRKRFPGFKIAPETLEKVERRSP